MKPLQTQGLRSHKSIIQFLQRSKNKREEKSEVIKAIKSAPVAYLYELTGLDIVKQSIEKGIEILSNFSLMCTFWKNYPYSEYFTIRMNMDLFELK